MMKKTLCFGLLLLNGIVFLFGQNSFIIDESIEIYEKKAKLLNPWQGGINTPSISNIDVNLDGEDDILLFDKSAKRVSVYLYESSSKEFIYNRELSQNFPTADYWIKAADYNCDNKIDLFLGTRNGILAYKNTTTTFDKPTFESLGLQNTVINNFLTFLNPGEANIPAIADVDRDGDLDFLFFGANPDNQIEYHKNLSLENNSICGLEFERRNFCWGNFAESRLSSEIFLDTCFIYDPNASEISVSDSVLNSKPKLAVHSKHGGSSITAVDLGLNGGMDLLLGDIGETDLKALYNGDTISPNNNSNMIDIDTAFPSYGKAVEIFTSPSAFHLNSDDDTLKDLVVSTFLNSSFDPVNYRNHVLRYKNIGNNQFEYQENDFLIGQSVDVGSNSHPGFLDYNHDGLMDLVISNFGNYYNDTLTPSLYLYKNIGNKQNAKFELIDTNYSNIYKQFINDSIYAISSLVPSFGDLNGNEYSDMLIGDFDGNIHFFEEDSTNKDSVFLKLVSKNYQRIAVKRNAAPFIYDIDRDGLNDLIIGQVFGGISYQKNYGDFTTPVFNLAIDSILYVGDSTFRFYTQNVTVLNQYNRSEVLVRNSKKLAHNNIYHRVVDIDTINSYVDLKHPSSDEINDSEINSMAIIDLSTIDFGKTEKYNIGNSSPIIYKNDDSTFTLLVGSLSGRTFLFNAFDLTTDSSFILLDSNIVDQFNIGTKTSVSAFDLNDDNLQDLIIGNEAGGLTFLKGKVSTNLVEMVTKTSRDLLIYPNPSRNSFTIDLENRPFTAMQVSIFNIDGKKLRSYTILENKTILKPNLGSGIYILQLVSAEYFKTKKIIIKNDGS